MVRSQLTENQVFDGDFLSEEEALTLSGTLQSYIDAKADTLLELEDTPNFYDYGKILQATSSGVQWTTVSGASGVSDHGELTGLEDDDHTQYILIDGSRSFTSTVAGVDPTQGSHLATKQYMEEYIGDLSDLMYLGDLEEFLDVNAIIVDSLTTLSGGWVPMSILIHRRELYNDTDNPLYAASVTPILGVSGTMIDAQDRISTLEYIHTGAGWHMTQISGMEARVWDLEYLHGGNGWHQTQISGINVKAVDAQDRVSDLEYIHTGAGWHMTQISGMEARVWNLEDIHSKDGWHSQEVKEATYVEPENLLIYYGWLNSFNYTENTWNNEKIAQDMARYTLICLGDGIQDPGHGDYTNAQVIIPRIKAINPYTKIFGYVTVNQTLSGFEAKTSLWDGFNIDGIFMDEAGYDYGTTRSGFNERVDYVHSQTYANLCFANAWEMDHVIGTTNDASFPNSTYNPNLDDSNLTSDDWFLLESHTVNTTSYTGNNGYESKTNWSYRGSKASAHRYYHEINLAAVGIINNSNVNGKDLFDFHFISSLMWSLEAVGTSDTSYGSGSAIVKFWPRPDVSWVGKIWSTSPTLANDQSDSDIYYRYGEFAKFMLDFSADAQDSSFVNYSAIRSGLTIDFVLGDGTYDYMATGSVSYSVARTFYFTGTKKWSPSMFGVIGSRDTTTTSGYVRLYDKTNTNEIVEIIWTAQDKAFYSTTALSDLPASPAIIELQYKTSSTNDDIRLHYMILE
jgi:hypothetical protein